MMEAGAEVAPGRCSEELAMSECHDIYELVDSPPAAQVNPAGAQCHDSYLAVPAGSGPAHECCLLSDRHGAVRVVRVIGRLDWATEDRVRVLLRDDCPDRNLIVDLSSAILDAAGTGVVLAATAMARTRGQQLVFVVADPVELEALTAAGLDIVVPVVASVGDALDWLGADTAPGRPAGRDGVTAGVGSSEYTPSSSHGDA
jgi:anti-anti-sigma regulatory factor